MILFQKLNSTNSRDIIFLPIKKWHLKKLRTPKYPCDQCDYKATQKGNLWTHLKSKHKGVKYPCDQCDYKASYKGHLLTHLKSIHEGVKYPCDQCDYKATKKGSLLSHIKSKHQGQISL